MPNIVFDNPSARAGKLVFASPAVSSAADGGQASDAEFLAWLASDDAITNILVETYALVAGVRTKFNWSTAGYTTEGIDSPIFYPPVVSPSIPFEESLSLSERASLAAGDIEIDNDNGINEAYAGYIWADEILAFVGDVRWARSDYRPIFAGHTAGLVRKGKAFALKMRDMMEGLNYPMTEQKLGTGTNPDALKPLTFGECCNASGVWSDAAALDRQWHDGPIEGIPDIRANGLPITEQVVVSEATGKAVLTVNNESAAITATVQGDKFGGVFRKTIASLVQRYVTGYGKDVGRYTLANIDLVNFAAFEAANPYAVGAYMSERQNVIDACDFLTKSVGAQLAPSLAGKLQLIKISLPAAGEATIVTKDQMFEGTLRHIEHIPPIASVQLGYSKNWTLQQGLQSNLPAAHRALFESEYPLYVTRVNDQTKADYKLDGVPTLRGTALLERADTIVVADADLGLWSVPRDIYEFEGTPDMLMMQRGQRLAVFHDEDGMIEGVEAQVLRVTRNWITRAVTVRFLK